MAGGGQGEPRIAGEAGDYRGWQGESRGGWARPGEDWEARGGLGWLGVAGIGQGTVAFLFTLLVLFQLVPKESTQYMSRLEYIPKK